MLGRNVGRSPFPDKYLIYFWNEHRVTARGLGYSTRVCSGLDLILTRYSEFAGMTVMPAELCNRALFDNLQLKSAPRFRSNSTADSKIPEQFGVLGVVQQVLEHAESMF